MVFRLGIGLILVLIFILAFNYILYPDSFLACQKYNEVSLLDQAHTSTATSVFKTSCDTLKMIIFAWVILFSFAIGFIIYGIKFFEKKNIRSQKKKLV